MSLDKNRRKIDSIDARIVRLLNERARESLKIRKIKMKLHKPSLLKNHVSSSVLPMHNSRRVLPTGHRNFRSMDHAGLWICI